jgi:hypothetical protein
MANISDGNGQLDDGQARQAEQELQSTARFDSTLSPVEKERQLGGSIFDPVRWKTPVDARLDPKAKIRSQTFSKVDVRKPPADHFVHSHPNPAFNGVFPLYADSEAKRYEPYLIAPELCLPPAVHVNVKQVRLAVTATDTGRLFLWFVPQTGSEWHASGDNSILTAMERWVKVIPDGGSYRLEFPEANLPEPAFPDWDFKEYLFRATALITKLSSALRARGELC